MVGKNIFRSRSVRSALLLSVLFLALIMVHGAELNSTTNQQDYPIHKQSASSSDELFKLKTEPVEAGKAHLDQAGETRNQNSETDSPTEPQALPNLTPVQLPTWSDKIVVSNVTGTHGDSILLRPTDSLFVDWAAINNGTDPVTAVFHTRLFVDGIDRGNWFTNPPLNPNFATFVDDFSIGSLGVGNHTLRIVVDVLNEIAEANEFDNEYTKFITVTLPGQPNLTPFQPTGWSDRIVVSSVTGTHSDSASLSASDTLFVDWAVINNGTAPTSTIFRVKLFVDGIETGSWISNPPLDTNFFGFVEDFSIGSLSAGTHALRIVADVFNEVAESNEFDNEYTKFISIASGQPNLTPVQPVGWSDRIVVSNVTGTHSDSSSLSPTDTLFVDWASTNNGAVQVSAVFHSRLFVDGIERGNWFTNPPLGTSSITFVDDFSIGSLSAGTHTLRIVVDVFNEIAESDEFDNEYTKFISVTLPGQPNLTPSQPTGWADKIVVSNVTGTHTDSGSLRPTDTLFVDWAALNNGTTPVSVVFHAKLFVDGIEKGGWFSNPPLGVGSFAVVDDFSIGPLSAGTHTLRIVADVLNEVAESNEFDNEYTKAITVSSQQCFTLTVNVSPSDGGSFGRNPQSTCPGLLIVQEPDFVSQQSSDLATGIASPSGLSRTAAVAQTFKTLISKAEAKGSVRVIVGVRTSFQPEGTLSTQATQSQRGTIALVQDVLLNRMAAFNVRDVKKYETIPFIAMEVDVVGLSSLENSADVTNIAEDIFLSASLAESVPLIGAPNAWASGFSGAGQSVAILDTGVDKTHPFLAGKVISEACYSTTAGSVVSVCPGGVANSTSPGSGVNCNFNGCEHGTHVAGIAAGRGVSFSGVAKDANIIAIQVFSQENSPAECAPEPAPCTTAQLRDVLAGLERVQTLAGTFTIASVNMSLGTSKFGATCDSAYPSMTAAIENLHSKGIATVISSGNEKFTDGMSFPACISKAVSVGSTGDGSPGFDGIAPRDLVSDFSNSAPFLNLLAPGKWILSSVPGGLFDNFSGTSMAAPHVAGAWAVLKSKSPAASVDQILSALTSTGVPITDFRNNVITPRIQVDAALAAALGGSGGSTSQYSPGTTVTLNASPNPGFSFVKWQRDGVDFSTSTTVSIQMGSDHTMTAVFRAGSATTITSLTFNGTKKLNLEGNGFGSAPVVLINNVDRSTFITGSTNTSISVKAKKKKLGIKEGDNTVQVIGPGGALSNVVLLRL